MPSSGIAGLYGHTHALILKVSSVWFLIYQIPKDVVRLTLIPYSSGKNILSTLAGHDPPLSPHSASHLQYYSSQAEKHIRTTQIAFQKSTCLVTFLAFQQLGFFLLILRVWAQFLVWELRTQVSQPKNQNIKQTQCCKKFNKDFKNGPH